MLHLHFALLSFLDIALCGSRTRRVLHIFNYTFALPLQVDSMLEVCNVFLLGTLCSHAFDFIRTSHVNTLFNAYATSVGFANGLQLRWQKRVV